MLKYEDGYKSGNGYESKKDAQNTVDITVDTYDKMFASQIAFQSFLSKSFSEEFLKGKTFTQIDSPQQFFRVVVHTPFYIVICLMGVLLYKPFAFYCDFLKETKETANLPPFAAVFLLCLFVPEDQYDAMDDAKGQFFDELETSGPSAAKMLYWSIVGRSIWPFVLQFIRKVVKWLLLGWLQNVLHRFIS